VRAADETPATSKIVAVDLFKNGLAVVKREVTLGKPGVYVIDDVPQPVHGTYWIESAGSVDTLVQLREVDVPAAETTPGNLQDDLAGKKVTVYFKGERRAPVVGVMMKFKPAKPEEAAQAARYLVIQSARGGRTYVDASEVASIESEEAGDTVKRRKPRLVLTLTGTDKPETRVAIHYLANGLSWAPTYKLDITDPKTLVLEQHAVIKNELSELKDAQIRLISGYPSVQFAYVRSLLSPGSTLANFFQELNGVNFRRHDVIDNSVLMQNAISHNDSRVFNVALGAIPTGEGVDLHYQPIGKRSLKEGDTLELTTGKGKAPYERVVEWMVPETHSESGILNAQAHGGTPGDSAWDALKFKNPLPFPMTTGPALVTANGQFNGQRTSYWVNPGEETVLPVEKALSVRTRSLENEQRGPGNGAATLIWIGGRQFRKSIVDGELSINNHRKEAIQMVIRRRFCGELLQAEGSPKSSLLEEGVYSINKRNELVWSLPLKAGEEKTLKYSYAVLVPY
jgi:hypothetical protein